MIGTGHVFKIGPTIRGAIEALRPDVVFVELDRGRYHALLHPETRSERAGYVHRKLQAFQEGVADMYGASVGEEMLAAVDGGRAVGARIAFVDPPAQDTLQRALRSLTWRERFRVVGMLVKGGFMSVFGRRSKNDLEAEIQRYQDDPEAVLRELQADFPTIYRVVIDERDQKMAAAIERGLLGARLGVAIVGDGHVPGMQRLLGRAQVYRLADVRAGSLPQAMQARGTPESVRFTVHFDPS